MAWNVRLLVLTFFMSLVSFSALSQACCATAFNVSDLQSLAPPHARDTGYSNFTTRSLNFTVHDPDPATNATTFCNVTWPAADAAPTTWTLCYNETFEWRFGTDFSGVTDYMHPAVFGISVRHTYEDPSVGQGIYGYRTTEGWLEFNHTIMDCAHGDRTTPRICNLKPGIIANIPILVES